MRSEYVTNLDLPLEPDDGKRVVTPRAPNSRPEKIHIGGPVAEKNLIKSSRAKPIYPAAAKSLGVEGTVKILAEIDEEGVPFSLQISNPEIDPDLARAAVEAIGQWRYKPMTIGGSPIKLETSIDVNFSIQRGLG